MLKTALPALPIALSLMVLSSPAQAEINAYWKVSSGEYQRISSGQCLRTGNWTKEMSKPECEGGMEKMLPPDEDKDGIPDSADKCPGTPMGTATNTDGCVLKASLDLENIEFESGTAVLSAESTATLEDIAETLIANKHMKFEVAGYTDNTGDDDLNTKLSRDRALSVRNFLVEQGVPESNLTAHGYGPRHPIASNDTAEGRAKNRRVELELKQ